LNYKKKKLIPRRYEKKNKNPFSLGKKWDLYLKKVNIFPTENLSTATKKIKRVIYLNKKLKSELSPFFFKPWIKKKRRSLTKRQRYLRNLYAKYRKRCSFKKRKDFLKTSFGEILKITHLHSELRFALWLSGQTVLSHRNVKTLKKKKKKKILFEPFIFVKKFEKLELFGK